MPLFAYLLARLSEPSSYAGLGAVLALLGWHLSDPMLGQIVQCLGAACGLLALLLKERGLIGAVIFVIAGAGSTASCGRRTGPASPSAITARPRPATTTTPDSPLPIARASGPRRHP